MRARELDRLDLQQLTRHAAFLGGLERLVVRTDDVRARHVWPLGQRRELALRRERLTTQPRERPPASRRLDIVVVPHLGFVDRLRERTVAIVDPRPRLRARPPRLLLDDGPARFWDHPREEDDPSDGPSSGDDRRDDPPERVRDQDDVLAVADRVDDRVGVTLDAGTWIF